MWAHLPTTVSNKYTVPPASVQHSKFFKSPLSYFNSNQKITFDGTEETYKEKRKPIQNKYMYYRIFNIYKSEIFGIFIY